MRSLADHPIPEPHPYGEDRSWCRCGAAAICDDIAFALWHCDDGTPAGVRCERQVPRRSVVRRLLARVHNDEDRAAK